ncbi:SH3 domain-containing protein [Streptomyces sp. NPDC004111]|uniref:SH3 domain-containing protein n=1 Tax=Streptomyces sp. NPDC004111 TaxID=3364690 RepID=UPI0036C2ED5C
MMRRTPRLIATAVTAGAALFALAASTGASAAPAAPAPVTAAHKINLVCTVNDDGVNFRGGPGPEYGVMGQVNRGQNMNYHGTQGNWVMGDLWGGPTGVWIHTAYLDNC